MAASSLRLDQRPAAQNQILVTWTTSTDPAARTPDLAGTGTTEQAGDAIVGMLDRARAELAAPAPG